MAITYTKSLQTTPNGGEIYHNFPLQGLPKYVCQKCLLLVWKRIIWQPWIWRCRLKKSLPIQYARMTFFNPGPLRPKLPRKAEQRHSGYSLNGWKKPEDPCVGLAWK
jgi:hypothetical protein